jgi:hypothetical protein
MPLRPVLELNHVVHDNMLSDVEEHVSPVIREELEIPRIQNAHVTNTSLVAHDDVQLLTTYFDSPAYAWVDMPTQNFVAHDDVQASPHPNPLVASSIPVDKEAVLEMERLARNPPSVVTQT